MLFWLSLTRQHDCKQYFLKTLHIVKYLFFYLLLYFISNMHITDIAKNWGKIFQCGGNDNCGVVLIFKDDKLFIYNKY